MKRLMVLALAVLPSCAWLPHATQVPVKALEGGNPDGTELVVFLPGRWSRVEEFEREKFFEIAANRWPDARLVAPDLHLGYYKNRSVALRLNDDVIQPARRSGVEVVRLVGISLGGLGALIYNNEYPRQVDEIILLSPYLGEDEVLAEIQTAGSLGKWRPGNVTDTDVSRKLWLNLRENWERKGNRPKVLLGCGTEDRLAPASRLFAREFLKPGEQEWIPGTHDWPTWRPLFRSLAR